MSETTTIEINGVKMEIDLRHAKRIDELRVGDRVKVLKKTYQDYVVYPGTIIGFEPFETLPTVIIAYVETTYNDSDIKFLYFNSQTTDAEIVKAIDDDSMDLSRDEVLKSFELKVGKLQREINEINEKKAYFEKRFSSYWENVTPKEAV